MPTPSCVAVLIVELYTAYTQTLLPALCSCYYKLDKGFAWTVNPTIKVIY